MRVRFGAVVLSVAMLTLGGCFAAGTQSPPGVVVVDQAPPDVPGYERGCGAAEGCVFGQAWSDDVRVRLGHNGCDTRNDLLGESLENPTFREGTGDCVVLSGKLHDPYTGLILDFEKENASLVQIDHVYPLSVAWDRGASTWDADLRRDFANDPNNLVATSAHANQEKTDLTPSQWLPAHQAGRCLYVAKFVDVARTYQLPVTREEVRVWNEVLAGC